MKNKLFLSVLIITIILPQIASAAWWNPFSWSVFGGKAKLKNSEAILPSSKENASTTTDVAAEIDKLKKEIEELKNKNESTQKAATVKQDAKLKNTPTKSDANITIQKQTVAISYEIVLNLYSDFLSKVSEERKNYDKNSSLETDRDRFYLANETYKKVNSDLGYLGSIKYWNPRPDNIENIYFEKFNKIKSDYDSQLTAINAKLIAEQKKNYRGDILVRLNTNISVAESYKKWLDDTDSQLRNTITLISNKAYTGGLIGECRAAATSLAVSELDIVTSLSASLQEDITRWKTVRDQIAGDSSLFVSKNDYEVISDTESIKTKYSATKLKISDILNSVNRGLQC